MTFLYSTCHTEVSRLAKRLCFVFWGFTHPNGKPKNCKIGANLMTTGNKGSRWRKFALPNWKGCFSNKNRSDPTRVSFLPLTMSEIFNRFSLHAAKFSSQVWLCLAVIWLVVLGCSIASIRAQSFSVRQQRFWLFVVICVPLFGVLAYLPFSFRREQLLQLFFIRQQKDRSKKAITVPVRNEGGRVA